MFDHNAAAAAAPPSSPPPTTTVSTGLLPPPPPPPSRSPPPRPPSTFPVSAAAAAVVASPSPPSPPSSPPSPGGSGAGAAVGDGASPSSAAAAVPPSAECLAAALAAEAAPEAALVCPSPASKEVVYRVDLDHDDSAPHRPSRRALALGHFLRFAQLPASAICHPTFVHLAAEFDITDLMPSVAELDAAMAAPNPLLRSPTAFPRKRKAPTDRDRDDGHDRDRASVEPQPPASPLRKRGRPQGQPDDRGGEGGDIVKAASTSESAACIDPTADAADHPTTAEPKADGDKAVPAPSSPTPPLPPPPPPLSADPISVDSSASTLTLFAGFRFRKLTKSAPVALPLPTDADEDIEIVPQVGACQGKARGYALVAATDPALSFAVPSSGRDAPAPSDVPVHIGVDGRPHVATTLPNEVYVQEKTAAVCIEILDREIKHASQEPVYYWLPRTPVSRTKASSTARQLCDECTTSIFCGYWFCAVCGKEICMDCFETALETSEVGDPTDAWRCASRGRGSPLKAHRPEQFIPVIKIPLAQLELVRERAMLLLTGPPRPDVVVPDVPGYDFASDKCSVVRLSSTTPPDEAERVFEREWSEGRPVLRSIDPGLIQADWSSKEFTAKFGDDTPTIVDCETKIEHHITVSNFFGGFDNSALRPQSKNKSLVLKLEDWPMTTDFADKLPEHFNDYTRCLPFPRYTSRTGDRNLAARLPQIHHTAAG
ncbi:hypothetical protein DFJ73DRAFT_944744 [Zopfochytrium polystomum]|nr:hypothetical protein DFJ73DRAFT_944744 [Zopfochytrium polystomum]